MDERRSDDSCRLLPRSEFQGEQRFWDGSAWTDNRQPIPAPAAPPPGFGAIIGVSESLGLAATNPSRYATPARWPALATTFAVGALVFTAMGDDGIVLCPFRRCTGGYCPGCGGTRAVRNLAQGNISGAWAHNPWVVMAAVQAVVVALGLAFVAAPRRIPRLRAIAMPLLAINTIMLIAIWIVRLHYDVIPSGWL